MRIANVFPDVLQDLSNALFDEIRGCPVYLLKLFVHLSFYTSDKSLFIRRLKQQV